MIRNMAGQSKKDASIACLKKGKETFSCYLPRKDRYHFHVCASSTDLDPGAALFCLKSGSRETLFRICSKFQSDADGLLGLYIKETVVLLTVWCFQECKLVAPEI